MGRPQRPIPDDDRSPAADFARQLRGLREDAGNPTLGLLARRTGYSDTTLSAALSGRGRPTLDVVLALVTALGGDPVVWEERWRALPGPAGAPAVAPADARADDPDGPAAPAAPADATANPAPPRRRRRLLVAAGAAAVLLAGTGVLTAVLLDRPDERAVVVTVQNQVTAGPDGMREDTPAYLSTVPENFCRPRGCMAPGPALATGDSLQVVCQTPGERTTNGNDSDPADDANPELHTSRLWYGSRLEDGGLGYLAETWLDPVDRGGLGLPVCER